MKREISLLALLAISVPLIGCGGSGSNANINPPGDRFVAVRDNRLIRGDVNNLRLATSTTITGIPGGTSIVAIDGRPVNGAVIALGDDNRIYNLDLGTSSVSVIGSLALNPVLNGTRFGFDFNPVVDRIRIVSNTGQNLRVNADTGVVAAVDANLSDANADIVAGAYSSNVVGAATTTLYGIDANSDTLVIQGGLNGSPSPNDGAITTIGSLGINVTGDASFDIGANGTAYLQDGANLYRVNLGTGQVTSVGAFAGGSVDAFLIGS